jgi:protein-S-isoprenylcysteine O-methyltransferase Ste14
MLTSVVLITGYTIAYSALHSWLATKPVKDWARRRMGVAAERWYRLAYNSLAVAGLLPLGALLIRLPDKLLYSLPPPWLWIALFGQLVAVLGEAYGLLSTDVWHFLGVRQLLSAPTARPHPLVVTGTYRWVRHPLYFWGLVFLWLMPQLTFSRLALNVVLSLYLYVGTFSEERRLVAEFGDAYRQYQRQVPRLIPWRGPVRVH